MPLNGIWIRENDMGSENPAKQTNPQTPTGDGAHIAANVTTDGGDFIGRDKTVHGDEVHGDKVTGDQITTGNIINSIGVAIGRGAKATVNLFRGSEDVARLRNRAAMLTIGERL